MQEVGQIAMVSVDVLKVRARAAVAEVAAWAKRAVTDALRLLPLVNGIVEAAVHSNQRGA